MTYFSILEDFQDSGDNVHKLCLYFKIPLLSFIVADQSNQEKPVFSVTCFDIPSFSLFLVVSLVRLVNLV